MTSGRRNIAEKIVDDTSQTIRGDYPVEVSHKDPDRAARRRNKSMQLHELIRNEVRKTNHKRSLKR